METKKAIKKIAALGTGALMTAMSFAGAFAQLENYPAPFIKDGKWVGLIAVGADAATADVIGATDIAATLAQEAVVTPGVTEVTGGVKEEVKLGAELVDEFGDILDDTDIDTLIDSSIEFADESIDVYEVIELGGGEGTGDTPVIAISSTSDKDYGKDPYMEVKAGELEYYYVFEDSFNSTAVSENEPLEIEFLGKTLSITDLDIAGNKIKAQIGDDYFMDVDSTVSVLGHTVKLVNVGQDAVVVSVDGTQETINKNTTEKVNGLRIHVKELFYSDTKAERSATLIIGQDAFKEYEYGDAFYIPCSTPATEDCDKDTPDWKWVIDFTNTGGMTTSGDKIGIYFDTTWNNDEDPVIGVGKTLYFPENYIWIKLDSLKTNKFDNYKIYFDDGVDLTDAGGSTDEAVFFIKGVNKDSLTIGGEDTKEIVLWYDGANIYAAYKNKDNKWEDSGLTNKNIEFTLNNGKTELKAAIIDKDNCTTTSGFELAIDADGDGTADKDDIEICIEDDTSKFIGLETPEEAEAEDLYFKNIAIGERKSDVLFEYGHYIIAPESTTDTDEVSLYVPNEQQAVNVIIGSTGTKVTTTGGGGTLGAVPVAMLDTEITAKTAKPLLIVGGPAVNRLAAEALGLAYPTFGEAGGTALGITAGEGTIKVIEDAFGGTNMAFIVAGWDAADTRNAATVLKDYTAYKDKLKGKQVIVKSEAGTIVVSAPTVTGA